MNRKIALLLIAIFSNLAIAAEFEINSEETIENSDHYKNVIASGYGVSEKKALDNAFKTAIQQYVGVLIDSQVQIENDEIIKDEILTASSGYIDSYNKLSLSNEDGIFIVEIEAKVKSQKVFEKIRSLSIDTIQISDYKNIAARVNTKNISKNDGVKILAKAFDEFFSPSSIKDILDVKILNVDVKENMVSEGKVPVKINFTISLNKESYENKVSKLGATFDNIGAKLTKRADLPKISSYGRMKSSNKEKLWKITHNNIGIVTIYGDGFKTDIWEFPVNYSNSYPLLIKNKDRHLGFRKTFILVLEIRNDSSVIYAEVVKNDNDRNSMNFDLLKASIDNNGNYAMSFSTKSFNIITPVLTGYIGSNFETNFSKEYSHTIMLPIGDLDKMKKVSLELELK